MQLRVLMEAVEVGIALGIATGILYSASSLLLNWWALGLDRSRAFMLASLGGTLGRLMGSLVLVGVILAFTEAHAMAFVGAFFIVFVLGLALEIAILQRVASKGDL